MADRDPFIAGRLAECRIETLVAAAGQARIGYTTGGWRRIVGRFLLQLGEALTGVRPEQPSLRPAGFAR